MEQHNLPVNGVQSYWTTGTTKLESLRQNLATTGLGDYCPRVRTEASTLKTAMKEMLPEVRLEGLKKQKTNGFEGVKITKAEDQNDYEVIASAKVTDGRVEVRRGGLSRYDLQEQFDCAAGYVAGASVTKCLVDILTRLGGVTLKPNGGLYWLPKASIDQWRQVARAVEASTGKNDEPVNKVYLLATQEDEDSIRAIRDAVVSEITGQAAALAEEIGSGQLGGRALDHRKDAAQRLHERVREFEAILAEPLDRLHTVIETVANAAAVAALQSLA